MISQTQQYPSSDLPKLDKSEDSSTPNDQSLSEENQDSESPSSFDLQMERKNTVNEESKEKTSKKYID